MGGIKRISLDYKLIEREKLSSKDILRMLQLMEENYNHIDFEIFKSDLDEKKYICILIDQDSIIQGFSTISINPNNSGTSEYSIIFSGDTIISPSHWGTFELVKGFCYAVAKIMSEDTSKKWYWFLLSKGHRTYMYLPLFLIDYYPSISGKNDLFLKSILDECAAKIYPETYNPNSGVLVFDQKIGELKSELSKATYEKKNKPQVQFFLEKNPKFYQGDELLCIADLNISNMKGFGKRIFLEIVNLHFPEYKI